MANAGSESRPSCRPSRGARWLAAAVAVAAALLALILFGAGAGVRAAWPWPEADISFVFLASITASVATVWASVALTGEMAALAGVGLNIVVAAIPALAYLVWCRVRLGEGLDLQIAFTLGACAFGIWLWRATRALLVRDKRPLPATVRWSYAAFVVTLLSAGSALLLQFQVFPWQLAPASATLFGCIFLGAAAFFANALRCGRWGVAAPALWGFLAYDLVLFVPYGRLLFADAPAADDYYGEGNQVNLTSLSIYLAVLVASTALALHAALVDPTTRLWGPRRTTSP